MAIEGWANKEITLSLFIQYGSALGKTREVLLGKHTTNASGTITPIAIDANHQLWKDVEDITTGKYRGYDIQKVNLVVAERVYPYKTMQSVKGSLALYLPESKGDMIQPTVKVCKSLSFEGRFADSENNTLRKILKYGEPARAQIRILNGYSSDESTQEKYLFTLFENKSLGDKEIDDFKKKEVELKSGEDIIDIPIDTEKLGKDTHVKDKKTASNPRLFYFLLEEKGRFVDPDKLTYPTGLADARNDETLIELEVHDGKNDAEIDKRNEKKIKDTGSKDRYDYFNQLKVAAETTLNKSLENKAMAIIGEPLTPSGKSQSTEPCTKCKEGLTEDTIKKIKAIPASYTVRLTQMLPSINKYMKAFGISDNCRRKAHFIGQVTKETGFWNMFEDFNHSKTSLDNANFPNRAKIKEVVLKNKDKATTEEEQIKVANIGYGTGTKASGLGNNVVAESDWAGPKQDGYKYRGRGLIQLTGKSNYIAFQNWYNKHKKAQGWADLDFVKDPDLLSVKQDGNKISNPEMLVLSAIYFWDKNNFNSKADIGYERTHTDTISIVVNGGEKDAARAVRHELFTKALSRIKDESTCALSNANRVPLTATDIIAYHTYADGRIIKQIPKINKYPQHYKYVYHDKNDKICEICVVEWNDSFKAENGKYKGLTSLPSGSDSSKAEDIGGGDGKTHHYYYDSDNLVRIVTYGTFSGRPYVSFVIKKDKVKLVKMPDNLNYNQDGVYIKLTWSNTKRRYTSPENFAAFIGALAECGFDVKSAGTAFKNGTGYPSQTHVNGASIDVSYSSKEKDLAIINAMAKYGYDKNNILTGTNKSYGNVSKIDSSGGHNDHIHFGPKVPPITTQYDK